MTVERLKLWFPYLLFGGIVTVVALSNVPSNSESTASVSQQRKCSSCGMEIDPADALREEIDGHTHFFCSEGCRTKYITGDSSQRTSASHADSRLIDVVCRMEVNPSWGIRADYESKPYYFCTDQCREQFLAAPLRFTSSRCLVCDRPLEGNQIYTATYLGKSYSLCSEQHRVAFKTDPAAYFMHSMWGIPTWLYYGSIAMVLIVSFGVFDWISRRAAKPSVSVDEVTGRRQLFSRDTISGEGERILAAGVHHTRGSGAVSISLPILATPLVATSALDVDRSMRTDRFDLLSIRWIKAAFLSRVFRFSLQAVVAILFLLVIAAGLFGNQNPALNIAPMLTWTIWWGLLIVLIMFAGKAWCYVCPWDAIAGWTEKLSFWRKKDVGLSLNLKWPRVVRNIAIATIFFVGLTWIELGFGVTMKPRITAYLAIGMLFMAVVAAMLFDRKSFCRYGCLVGRVSGLYALFGATEVRSKSATVCKSCQGKECVQGSETAYGCPTFLYPGKLETNTYCIQCMECLQACPHDNLAVNLRPWGSDLAQEGKPRADEAYLALLMLSITGFHGLTMTPVWQQLIDAIRSAADIGRVLGFSIGMALLMLTPIGVYALLVGLSKQLGQRRALRPLTYRDYFIRYAYALLPIALFYHIAHNMEHLLMEGPKVVAMISDPFGWGWNLFGTAAWIVPPMISLDKLWLVQVLLVLIGHVYSLWVAQKTSHRLFGSTSAAFRSQLPMLVGMICFSVLSLWLLKQPMEMRTSAM